jgi:hypothetical protein
MQPSTAGISELLHGLYPIRQDVCEICMRMNDESNLVSMQQARLSAFLY